MFTGIVEELGTVAASGNRFKVHCEAVLKDAAEGSSIAVNGVCLTAVKLEPRAFWADLSPETLACTNLGALKPGAPVNLERPVRIGDRLSGHIVQGHVDSTAEFVSLTPLPDLNWLLAVRVPPELERYLIVKGSITLDGVSLTIASLQDSMLSIAIIPHTYEHTAFRAHRPGERVNVEVDMIAKYVEKLTAARPEG